MIYTFLKISSREDASLDRYWIDPSGIEYYVDGFNGTHMQWIFSNLDVLQPEQRDVVEKSGLDVAKSERFAERLYELGWVRISENVVLMGSDREMPALTTFIKRHSNDSNLDVSPDKKITIIKMNPETHEKISIENILSKYGNNSLQLAASFGRISSKDAVKDTQNYWTKAKNKDFNKYYRKLRRNKKRRANYIPNPDTKVPQPLKRNWDYTGENWIDKIQRIKKRKENLNTI